MKSYRFSNWLSVCMILVLLVVSLACGSSTTKELSEATQPTATTGAEVVEHTPTPAGESVTPTTPRPTATRRPTATPKPTAIPASPTPQPEAIQIVTYGFGQDGREAGFAFIVENPNPGLAFEDSRYQIAAYNADGVVVETESGYLELLLPGQKLGIGGTIFLDEGITVDKIEVQLSEGNAVATEPIPTFAVDAVSYTADEYFPTVTGVISSPYKRDINDLRVSAVVYNAAGEIIGGGFTFLNFILADGSTGVKVSVTSAGDIAEVELYPVISGLSLLTSDTKLPSEATDLVLVKYGFGQDGNQAGFGMLIENPNEGFSVESTQYHLTAYAENGNVLAVEEGYVNVLLPKQTLGVGGQFYLKDGVTVARLDVQIKSGNFEAADAIPFFTAETVTYQTSDYLPKVTGQIISPYNKDITDVRVSAIVYNEAGDIIGGGFTYVDFVPANGKAAASVSVTAGGKPATAELYTSPSSLSEYK